MDRAEIYEELNVEREFVTSPDSGYVVKKEAWTRIDGLLDLLSLVRAEENE